MYSQEEIDLLWGSLPSTEFMIEGVEQRFYYRGESYNIYVSYDALVEVINGCCTENKPVGKDLVVRLFLRYVPLEDVPLFLNTPLAPYASWRLKIGK